MTTVPIPLQPLVSAVLVRAPGLAADMALRQVVDAAREFFVNTCVWNEEMTVHLSPGVENYHLVAPEGCSIAWMLAPTAVIPYARARWRLAFSAPSTLRVFPVPDVDDDVRVRVALAPQDETAPFPPSVMTAHHDALVDGALSRVYSVPNVPYSQPQMALYHGRRFRNGMTIAREALRRNYAQDVAPVVFHPRPAAARGAP